ncbi:hypothetical protein C9374_012625 [Naegleria lovaniensis]|uniref:RWP-RK domain-containing protein n=1 Tax=Naegleria lovaniensis TaxID=51637 RepID=A0AA88GWM0_NAELO|nr:uncharacterized protein C9374_012625 [Naegleria lovaniensis]KAG2392373.1 hypothetical protein C9374_012625 [Naegleria lovaniensis]
MKEKYNQPTRPLYLSVPSSCMSQRNSASTNDTPHSCSLPTIHTRSSSKTCTTSKQNSLDQSNTEYRPAIHVFKVFEVTKSPKKDWTKPLRKRSSQCISLKEMISVLHLTQPQACKVLGCSVSTVKRRFSELKQQIGLSQWPKDYFELEKTELFEKIYPLSLSFILNHDDEGCSSLTTSKNQQER